VVVGGCAVLVALVGRGAPCVGVFVVVLLVLVVLGGFVVWAGRGGGR
jgi:hypothetical protein